MRFHFRLSPASLTAGPVLPASVAGQHFALVNRKNESIEHKKFYEIIDYLNEGDILVRNSTKVIPARLFGHKETGGVLEILLIKRIDLDTWECLLKPAKKLKIGQKLFIGHGNELIGELLEIKDDGNRQMALFLSFSWMNSIPLYHIFFIHPMESSRFV